MKAADLLPAPPDCDPSRPRNIIDLPWQPDGDVLDPFAGDRKWWSGVDTTRVTFCDQHPSHDDVLEADAATLPFPDNYFDEVWADPPHLIRNDIKHWTKGYARFGHYTSRKELERLWPLWSAELRRVCSGYMVLKTVDGGDHRVIKRHDLRMFLDHWRHLDEIWSKTSPGWSRTVTVYTLWEAI